MKLIFQYQISYLLCLIGVPPSISQGLNIDDFYNFVFSENMVIARQILPHLSASRAVVVISAI